MENARIQNVNHNTIELFKERLFLNEEPEETNKKLKTIINSNYDTVMGKWF